MWGGQQTSLGFEQRLSNATGGYAQSSSFGGASSGNGVVISQGFGAVRQVAALCDALVSRALANPKAGRASTMVHLFRSELPLGSKLRNDLDLLLQLTGRQLRQAEDGLLFDLTLPADFSAEFWPELPDGAAILGNVLKLLRGPEGIPDPSNPANQQRNPPAGSAGSNPPGLSKVAGLVTRLQDSAVAVEKAQQHERDLQRCDYGISSAEAVVSTAEAEKLRAGAAARRQTADAMAASVACIDARTAYDTLQGHLRAAVQGSEEARDLRQQVEAAASQLSERLAQEEAAITRSREAAEQHNAATANADAAHEALKKLQDQFAAELEAARQAVDTLEMQRQDTLQRLNDEVLQQQQGSTSAQPDTRRAHERMYVTAGNVSMTSAIAYVRFLAALLSVKWGYPTNAQFNGLGVITRGKPSFEGEEPFVPTDESYTAFFARIRHYKRQLQLINRDRDLTSPTLAGLGTSPVDDKVRGLVQAQVYSLAAVDRTPEVLERKVMQAFQVASDDAEAMRQVHIQQLAESKGLGAGSCLGLAGGPPRGPPKLKLSDVKPGLVRPIDGWGDSLEVILKKVGPGPDDLCPKHTGARCRVLHTTSQCRTPAAAGALGLGAAGFYSDDSDEEQVPAAQPSVADAATISSVVQLLQGLGLNLSPMALAADPTFRSTMGQSQQPFRPSSSPRGNPRQWTRGEPGSQGEAVPCTRCGRVHYGGAQAELGEKGCWGANMEYAPAHVRERFKQQQQQQQFRPQSRNTGPGRDAASNQPRMTTPDQRTVYAQQQPRQQRVAAAMVDMFPAEDMHPHSITLQQTAVPLQDVLPQPRASSYASYGQLGGHVSGHSHSAMMFALSDDDVRLILSGASQSAAAGAAAPVAAAADADTGIVLSMLSSVASADELAIDQVESLSGFDFSSEPVAASVDVVPVTHADFPPLQQQLPRTFVQSGAPALSATVRRSSRIAARCGELDSGQQRPAVAAEPAAESDAERATEPAGEDVEVIRPPSPPAPGGLSIILMTDSGEDRALMDAAMQHAGFRGVVLVTSALSRLLNTGVVQAASMLPAMTLQASHEAARLAAGTSSSTAATCSSSSVSGAPDCVRLRHCGCARCLAEDDSAAHGAGCPCLACMPEDAAAEADAVEASLDYINRDASIAYIVNRGGFQIGLESASQQFVGVKMGCPDTGASMSCCDHDDLLGLGLPVKAVPNVELRAVGQHRARFEGVASTRVVYKPGTRHELVAPIYLLSVKGLKQLASMLLGRVEQHRIGAVIDTMRQQMLYMPKLHKGRHYHASIPLLCHKATPLQQELQQLARDATAAVAAAIPVPRGVQMVALVAPNEPPRVMAAYADDLIMWDPVRGHRFVDLRAANARVRAAVGHLAYVAGEQRRQQQQHPAAPIRLSAEAIQRANVALDLLLRAGDIEPNPGPGLSVGFDPASFFAVVKVVACFLCSHVQYFLSILLSCWYTAAAVIRLLLACSGDVEPNPGPPVRDDPSNPLQQWQMFQQRIAGTFRSGAQ